MSGNMIARLGREWCEQRVVGGHFVHDGKLLMVRNVLADGVSCIERKTDKRVMLPLDVFTGFKIFRYPPLGYRKFGPGLAVWLTKQHSYNRGLRERCIQPELSPVSELLHLNYNREMQGQFNLPESLLELVFFPEYDTVEELPKLYEGVIPSVVLNENVLVEANVSNERADGHIVYFKRRPCAAISKKQKFRWLSSAYEDALSSVFKRD